MVEGLEAFMPLEELLNLLRRRPFVPFRIHLTDGASYEVRHPEMLMPGARSITIGIPGDPTIPIYSRTEIVALVHIVRLERLEEATPAAPGQSAA
jgi:hypothetical protein